MQSLEQLTAVVEAVRAAGGNRAQAARDLGANERTVRWQYAQAVAKGLTGGMLGVTVPDAFTVDRLSVHTDKDGTESGWVIMNRDKEELVQFLELVAAECKAIPPVTRLQMPPDFTLADWLTVYPIVDHHLGMYSWARETGQNYDLAIAERALLGTLDRLFQWGPPSETALLLGLGDWFHADNTKNMTENSGHPLDVDGRYAKVLQLGVKLWRKAIDTALLKHQNVKVRILPGNHDEKGAIILAMCLAAVYEKEPRVLVDTDPSLFYFFQWGNTMIGAHHGHTVAAKDFPQVMAAIKPQMWGETEFRYCYSGHLHRHQKGGALALDAQGAEYEIFPASTARDAWNASKGFTSKRAMYAITFNMTEGEKGRYREYVKGE